ncbi:MAG: response regulator [Campylobacterales bacterium]|nr:response regulator [Campylobacterales bacterium]
MKILIVLWLLSLLLHAQEDLIRFGVYQFKGKELTQEEYAPLLEHLNAHLGKKVVLEVLSQEEIEEKIKAQTLDIVTTNPTHFLFVRKQHALSGAIATLITECNKKPVDKLGGVIVVRRDSPIYNLKDLIGTTIAVPSKKNMGGFRAQAYELLKIGIDIAKQTQIMELQTTHHDVVRAVLDKKVEAGFVRSGIIESMVRDGAIDSHHLRIINQKTHHNYPMITSTALYPEWPVFALKHTDPDDVKLFASTLFTYKPATLQTHNGIYGYTLPADYLEVEELSRALRLPPFENYGVITLRDIWQKYRYSIVLMALLFMVTLFYYVRAQRRKKLFQSLVSNLGDGVYSINREGKCLFINQKALDLLGYREDEVLWVDQHLLFHYKHEDNSLYEEESCPIYRTVIDRKTRMLDEYFITKSGTLLPISLTVAPTDNGGAIVVFRDVSEQKALYHKLQMEQDLFSQGPVITIEWAPQEHWPIRYVSKNVEVILGYGPSEMIDEAFSYGDLIHPDDFERVSREVEEKIRRHDVAFEQSYRLRKKDGSYRWFYDFTRLVWVNEQLVSIHGYMFDQTQLKQVQEEIILAKEEAEKASRTKSNFLANMSHEIRTPMNAIIGLSQLLLQGDLKPKERDFIDKINSSSKMLLGIINDILDYSKMEAGKMELEAKPVELENVLEQLRTLFVQLATKKELELYFKIDPEVPWTIIADELRINQILTNLLSNALKFTQSGNITLSISLLRKSESNATLYFSISDTGIGMSEVQIAKLFEPFTQADSSTTRKYGGTGLGLTISKRLVEAMGGMLGVSSRLNQGSTFSFAIDVPVLAWSRSKPQIANHPCRVLVVDDQPIAREILKNILHGFTCSVDEAANGQEAIEKLLQADQAELSYDYMLLDWQMPVMDGKETIKRINQLSREGRLHVTPPMFYMISAYTFSNDEALPISSFLAKPITASSLYKTLFESSDQRTQLKQTLPDFSGMRVLLVEDNEINQEVASMMLEQVGIDVTVAANGQEAIDRLFSDGAYYDLILMDLQMPVMGGYEATRLIRARNSVIPIIALTAAAMIEDRHKALEAGMNDHLGKPIESQELYRLLAQWGKREAYHSALPQEPSMLPSTEAVLDMTHLNRLMKGNQERISKLLEMFAHNLSDEFHSITASVRAHDPSAPASIHALKGVSANMGAKALTKVCSAIDACYKTQTQPDDQVIDALEYEIDRVKEHLKAEHGLLL